MDKPARRPPGRPRQNKDGAGDGNPTLRIRMAPELLNRVQSVGGSTWARAVLEAALPEAEKLAREGAPADYFIESWRKRSEEWQREQGRRLSNKYSPPLWQKRRSPEESAAETLKMLQHRPESDDGH